MINAGTPWGTWWPSTAGRSRVSRSSGNRRQSGSSRYSRRDRRSGTTRTFRRSQTTGQWKKLKSWAECSEFCGCLNSETHNDMQ